MKFDLLKGCLLGLLVLVNCKLGKAKECLAPTSANFEYSSEFRDQLEEAPAAFYGLPAIPPCQDTDRSRCSTRTIQFEVFCVLKKPDAPIREFINIGPAENSTCGSTVFSITELEARNMYIVLVKHKVGRDFVWFDKYDGQFAAIVYNETMLPAMSESCGLDATWGQPYEDVGLGLTTRCLQRSKPRASFCGDERQQCPDYWYRVGGACYGLGKGSMTRADAVDFCSRNSHGMGELAALKIDAVALRDLVAEIGAADDKWWTAGAKMDDVFKWNGEEIFGPNQTLTFNADKEFLVLTGDKAWATLGADDMARPLCREESKDVFPVVDFISSNTDNNDPKFKIDYDIKETKIIFCCKTEDIESKMLSITTSGEAYPSHQVQFENNPRFYLDLSLVPDEHTLSTYTIVLLDVSGFATDRGNKLEPYALWVVVNVPWHASANGELRPDYGDVLLPSGGKATDSLVSLEFDHHPYAFIVFRQDRKFNASVIDLTKLSPEGAPSGGFFKYKTFQQQLGLNYVTGLWFDVVMDAYSARYQVTVKKEHSTKWCPHLWPDLTVRDGQVICAEYPKKTGAAYRPDFSKGIIFVSLIVLGFLHHL